MHRAGRASLVNAKVAPHCTCPPHRVDHELAPSCVAHSATSRPEEIECLYALLRKARLTTYGIDRLSEELDPVRRGPARPDWIERTRADLSAHAADLVVLAALIHATVKARLR